MSAHKKAHLCTYCAGAGERIDDNGEAWMCGPCDGEGVEWLAEDDVEGRMARHGFYLQETGGGCTAYVRQDNPSDPEIEEIITVVGTANAPQALTDSVAIGTHCLTDPQDMNAGTSGLVDGYTLKDVLAALDNPSDEYTLLDLRLHNGFHKR